MKTVGDGIKIEIDGAEGGGQILRTSLSLACITSQSCKITNIRKNRPKPGLRPQHIAVVNTLAELYDAKVTGNHIGSSEITFVPGPQIRKRLKLNTEVKIPTAGSIGLLLQALELVGATQDLEVEIIGGSTASKWSPPVPYIENVFHPLLNKLGYFPSIEVKKHGFYPMGGAHIILNTKTSKLTPLSLKDKCTSHINKTSILSIASNHLRKSRVAERQANAALTQLTSLSKNIPTPKPKIKYVNTLSPGSIILIYSKYKNTVLGADFIGERGIKSEFIGKKAALKYLETVRSRACLDIHASDMILPYLALCEGKSQIKVQSLTDHCRNNIKVIKMFLDKNIGISGKIISVY